MKSTTILVALMMGGLLCACSGCAQMIEANAIEDFTFALQEQNLDQLRETTSPEFGDKALRRAESLRDLKILNLPQEPPSVVNIEDVTEDQKNVTVQVGERGQRLLYKLVREPGTEDWVVDDIYMKQRKKGLKVTKSVTEQMDLLLTVREFLDAWETGSRTDVLGVTASQLSGELAELPPAYLQQLTRRITGDPSAQSRRRPEAQLDQNVAIVRLPRAEGSIILNLRLLDGAWKVSDIAVDTGDPETSISSTLRTAHVLNSAVAFLDAYGSGNKAALKECTTDKLYRHSLLPADLAQVRLPETGMAQGKLDIRLYGNRATYVTPFADQMVKIDMVLPVDDEQQEPLAQAKFVVSEVTLYKAGSNERRRLSAVFTARERVRLFVEALAARDLQMIRAISTPELNDLIWRRVDHGTVSILPIYGVIDVAPTDVQVSFQGAYTEINTLQNGVRVKYHLQDWNGELGLHDVFYEQHGFPSSLRTRLELYLPVLEFGLSVHRSDVNRLKRTCSDDFNRLVWAQVPSIPSIGFPVSKHLQTTPTAMTLQGAERGEVRLGDESWGARVALTKQRGLWVVDEVLLIAGTERERRAEMKQTIRIQIANGLVSQKHAREYRADFLGVESRTSSGYASMPARVPGEQSGPQTNQQFPVIAPRPRPQSSVDQPTNAPQEIRSGEADRRSGSVVPSKPRMRSSLDAAEELMPPIDIPLN